MVSFWGPASNQCFTSIRLYLKASPKAISRRTSYLRVRLEFLPYPHLIATLFNGCAFGPPLPLTAASTWTWIDHPVSGLLLLTLALLRLGFPTAPHLKCLTLPVSVTRRTVLQKVRGCAYKALPQLVDTGFQVLFHSPPGVLFTFPSQYFFAIGHQGIFRLGGWSLRLPSGFHVSRCTLDTTVGLQVSYTRLSLSLACFPKTILLPYLHHMM